MRWLLALILLFPLALAAPAVLSQTIQGKPVTYIKASLKQYRLEVALSGSRVGDQGDLDSIAQRSGAVCAINGTFLAAYRGQSGEPWGTLVQKGQALHLGSLGTRLDIYRDGSLRFVRDGLRVRGQIDGKSGYPHDWYAYTLNQTPSTRNYAYVFTPARGSRLGFAAEMAVVTSGGVVQSLVRGSDVGIPADGFVLALGGAEVGVLGKLFRVGQRLDYRVQSKEGRPLEAYFSLGAGPRLLAAGQMADYSAEGFSGKLLGERGQRSAVGLTGKGELIFAVMGKANVREEAQVMRALGAVEAMNLDGGASSGLYCNGRSYSRPGRKIANALVLLVGRPPR